MLPYADYLPTSPLEAQICVAVAPDVRLDFLTPPIRVGLGPCAVHGASVPETTVEKDGHSLRRKGNVYRSSAAFDELAMQSKSQTPSM